MFSLGSIIKKKIKNHIYYYYVESKRINGKPKYVNQKYLGTAESLLKKLVSMDAPLQPHVLHSEVTEFGAVSLLYDIADRLGICKMIDDISPKRKQGASTGEYILTAAINRAVSPTSTNGLQEWYADTCLPMITGKRPNLYTPQNFWNNTCIPVESIDAMEDAILRKVIGTYNIDMTHIIYDATNFFTYIDTMQKCESAKRGYSKEKRNDLRIIGLSLMVSSDFSIPLLHETYPGNRPDAKQFYFMMDKLKKRYESITGHKSDVTVVFDRGNNSEDNINFLEESDFPFHYVGGLKKNQAKELYKIPSDEYVPLGTESLKGQFAYRAEIEIYRRKVTALIVYNPELEKGQLQGILINREKTTKKLLDLQQKLIHRANGKITKGKKPTKSSITKKAEDILKVEYMKSIFHYEVIESKGHIYLTFASSDEALKQLQEQELGKKVLFTDRSDFTNEEIVNAYRSAWHVESAFKQMKNIEHLRVRPVFHWTDEKIRVHIFTCILAYRLCCLLLKELNNKGIHMSINRLLNEMAGIKHVDTFFGDIDKPEKVQSFTLGSELAQQVEDLYQLKRKYS